MDIYIAMEESYKNGYAKGVADAKNLWIPANERKPQEFVSVLIYTPGEVPLPAVHEAYYARGCWVTHIMVLKEHEVTHWMDMPDSPREVK